MGIVKRNIRLEAMIMYYTTGLQTELQKVPSLKRETKRKKYRITSKFRFTLFLGILALAALLLLNGLLSIGTVSAESYDTYQVVKVESGDTLWTIADRYGSKDTDLRRSVDRIMHVNGIEQADDLRAGQEILVPAEA